MDARYVQLFALRIATHVIVFFQGDIANRSEETRDGILSLLRPFTMSSHSHTNKVQYSPAISSRSMARYTPTPAFSSILRYGIQILPHYPNLQLAAIILTFAITEATHLNPPAHLPVDRLAAQLANRNGPTQADFRLLNAQRTPLIAAILPRTEAIGSTAEFDKVLQARALLWQDPELQLTLNPLIIDLNAYQMTCERMSGLWEGSYMVCHFHIAIRFLH